MFFSYYFYQSISLIWKHKLKNIAINNCSKELENMFYDFAKLR